MDYCHACRRHLNGALACAGCGTPAEYLPPAAPVAASVPGVPDASGYPPPTAAGPARGGFEDPFADSLVVLSGRHQGRAGSRRRATHRRRRRTAVLIGAGLALAVGGSVVLARIVTEGERTDRAAKVVLTDGNGPQDPAPLPSSRTGAPAAPSALKPVKSAGGAKATAGATQSAGAGASAAATAQPGPGVSPSASGKAVPSASASGAGPSVKPGQSGQPAPTGSGTAKPPPPNPAPSPTPTKTGCWFIFFC